jgi:hypothetical protein
VNVKGTARASANVVAEAYRLVSIDAAPAPHGDTGQDWLVYKIAQGSNFITGYRRGSRQSVGAEVDRIVTGLNERLLVRGRPYRSAGRPTKAAAQTRHKDLV